MILTKAARVYAKASEFDKLGKFTPIIQFFFLLLPIAFLTVAARLGLC